jgi:hypothetical protein
VQHDVSDTVKRTLVVCGVLLVVCDDLRGGGGGTHRASHRVIGLFK